MTAAVWTEATVPSAWRQIAHRSEEMVLAAILALMLLIPIAESALRGLFHVGISGSTAIVQHCTLVLSMLGAAMAAREKRLLSLATAAFMEGRVAAVANLLSTAVAAAVSILLAMSGWELVKAERLSGHTLVYGFPIWLVQMVLPIGFVLIAARIVMTSSEGWLRRVVIAAIAATLVAIPTLTGATEAAVMFGWLSLALAALCGAPLFAVLGGATLALNWRADIPIGAAAVSQYSLVVNPSLPAIPLFTLAGYLLAEGGASQRLVRVFKSVVGNVRGGPAIITTVACAFFTSFTGGSGVTILALGGLLLPILIEANYSQKNALGLVTAAGSLGLLFPPCLPLILYAIAAQVDMRQMFLGGFLPGCLLLVMTAALGIRQQERPAKSEPFQLTEALRAIGAAKWELLLPIGVLVLLLNGWATAVETAAATALYALFIETVIYRELRNRGVLLKVFKETALLVGGILVILGVALAFTSFLVDAEIPQIATDWVTARVDSKLAFLLILNLFLLAVGAMMDIYSAIVVVVPLLVPLGRSYGIDPIHLGVIFLANLELGYLIPPVGENLFISSYRFNKPIGEVYRATVPMILIFLVAVLVITYFPPMTTWLPRALAG